MPTAKGSIPWNKGKGNGWVDARGYRWLYVQDGGKTVARREHRVIVEASIGRKLEPWELVHHKDGDKANNAIENLEIKEFGTHTAEHHKGTRKSEDAKRTMEAFGLMREELKRKRAINAELLEALRDMLAGWRYIRDSHGDLYGVGWDRAQEKAEAAILKATGEQA